MNNNTTSINSNISTSMASDISSIPDKDNSMSMDNDTSTFMASNCKETNFLDCFSKRRLFKKKIFTRSDNSVFYTNTSLIKYDTSLMASTIPTSIAYNSSTSMTSNTSITFKNLTSTPDKDTATRLFKIRKFASPVEDGINLSIAAMSKSMDDLINIYPESKNHTDEESADADISDNEKLKEAGTSFFG